MTAAVLGLGSIGLRHARNLLSLGQAVVGFDPDPERRRMLEAEGGRTFDTRSAALGNAKAAVVASPSQYHADDLSAALDAGCHVLAEKPLAHSDVGLDGLLEKAREQGLVVFVAHNLRYHPCVEAAREILEAGRLGDLLWARLLGASYLPDWRPHQDYRRGFAANPVTGGALFDFIHEFDLAAHLLGPFETVAAVARRTGTLDMESEDCVDAILRHSSGVCSAMHVDYVTRSARRVTEIVGTEGALKLDLLNRDLTHFDPTGAVIARNAYGGEVAEDYVREMKAFLECLRGRAEPKCCAREALAILTQVVAARAMAGLPAA
jgi:predicted dehydrogenase